MARYKDTESIIHNEGKRQHFLMPASRVLPLERGVIHLEVVVRIGLYILLAHVLVERNNTRLIAADSRNSLGGGGGTTALRTSIRKLVKFRRRLVVRAACANLFSAQCYVCSSSHAVLENGKTKSRALVLKGEADVIGVQSPENSGGLTNF